jgi:hypothetical protein
MADLTTAAAAPVLHADPALTGPLADAGADDKAAVEAIRSEKRKAADDKETRKAAILVDLEKAKAKARAEAPADDAKPTSAKPATEPKPAKDIEQVAKLSAELRTLKAELAKFADKKPGESKADLIAALKKDPGLIFTELADEPELMVKLAEARQKQLAALDPKEREIAELKDGQAKIQKQLDEAAEAVKAADARVVDKNTYDATAKVLDEGYKDEAGKVIFDQTPFVYSRAFTKAGEVDAPRLAMDTVTEMVRELGRPPTDAETATLLTIAFEKTEARLKKWAEIIRGAEPTRPALKTGQKTEAVERPKDRRPPTIASAMGRGGHVPVMRAPESKADRKKAIYDRLVTQKRQAAPL